MKNPGNQNDFLVTIPVNLGSSAAPVRFTVGIHIEIGRYLNNKENFSLDSDRLRKMGDIIAAHHGKMTVQFQKPFTTIAKEKNDDVLRHLALEGHDQRFEMPASSDTPSR